MPVESILLILQTALTALAAIPTVGPAAALAVPFIQIVQSAMSAYHQATGQPLDLTKIPLEKPVS